MFLNLNKKYFIKGYYKMLEKASDLPFSYEELKKITFKKKEYIALFLEYVLSNYWEFLEATAFSDGKEGISKPDMETLLILYSYLEYLKEKILNPLDE